MATRSRSERLAILATFDREHPGAGWERTTIGAYEHVLDQMNREQEAAAEVRAFFAKHAADLS